MSYILGQYNKVKDVEDDIFMTLVTDGEPIEIRNYVESMGDIFSTERAYFSDNAIYFSEPLEVGQNYFFHGKIRVRNDSSQTVLVKLVQTIPNMDGLYEQTPNFEQYIETESLELGRDYEWKDFSFQFCPLVEGFNTLKFELSRTFIDYSIGGRKTSLVYIELSKIHNLIPKKITNTELLKIGVQSRPGLRMCINNEDIYVGRSGIYEIRNGIITITFFSVIASCQEKDVDLVTNTQTELVGLGYGNCKVLFDSEKDRNIDSFTLDYVYELNN